MLNQIKNWDKNSINYTNFVCHGLLSACNKTHWVIKCTSWWCCWCSHQGLTWYQFDRWRVYLYITIFCLPDFVLWEGRKLYLYFCCVYLPLIIRVSRVSCTSCRMKVWLIWYRKQTEKNYNRRDFVNSKNSFPYILIL